MRGRSGNVSAEIMALQAKLWARLFIHGHDLYLQSVNKRKVWPCNEINGDHSAVHCGLEGTRVCVDNVLIKPEQKRINRTEVKREEKRNEKN